MRWYCWMFCLRLSLSEKREEIDRARCTLKMKRYIRCFKYYLLKLWFHFFPVKFFRYFFAYRKFNEIFNSNDIFIWWKRKKKYFLIILFSIQNVQFNKPLRGIVKLHLFPIEYVKQLQPSDQREIHINEMFAFVSQTVG